MAAQKHENVTKIAILVDGVRRSSEASRVRAVRWLARCREGTRTLGDYRWQIIRRVSLPLARPGIVAGITLAWVRTLGEFGATLVMAYHPNRLPVFLWVQLTSEGLRAALPLALMLMAIGAGTIATVHLLGLVPGVAVGVAPETSWRKTEAPAMARREP